MQSPDESSFVLAKNFQRVVMISELLYAQSLKLKVRNTTFMNVERLI
jgi:hypothetical protein